MHAPSLFPGPKPNHFISLCLKNGWLGNMSYVCMSNFPRENPQDFNTLLCPVWNEPKIALWNDWSRRHFVKNVGSYKMIRPTKNTIFTKLHGWPEKKSLQNASVCYKNAPAMEHGSSHVIVEMSNVHRDQNTPCPEHFLQVATSKEVHADVMRSTFPSQNLQAHHVRTTFGSCHEPPAWLKFMPQYPFDT